MRQDKVPYITIGHDSAGNQVITESEVDRSEILALLGIPGTAPAQGQRP
jgi:hypothetical protein